MARLPDTVDVKLTLKVQFDPEVNVLPQAFELTGKLVAETIESPEIVEAVWFVTVQVIGLSALEVPIAAEKKLCVHPVSETVADW
jgi:hypothetical protein